MTKTENEDSYKCENCGVQYNTILEPWRLPSFCYECGEKHPWKQIN